VESAVCLLFLNAPARRPSGPMAIRTPCLAKPHGEPCTGHCETPHPYLPEIRCCFLCAERQKVMRESARLSTEGVPLVSDKSAQGKFALADYQHPTGSAGGLARETLCALCTQPANGDELMLECRGSRGGAACKLAFHKSCQEACSRTLSGGAAVPPPGGVLQCCTGWAARAEMPEGEKDRFCQPYTHYRKELARRGSLGGKKRLRLPVDATPHSKVFTPQTLPRAQPPAGSSASDGSEPTGPTAEPATALATSVATPLAAASEPAALAAAALATAKPQRRCLSNEPEAAAIGGAVGGAGAGTGWVAAADDPGSKGRPRGPRDANVGGIDWKSTAVDAILWPDGNERGGAQCFVFLAVLRDPSARSADFGDVWRLGTDGVAPKHGLNLAVKTPKPVTEPEGDSEGAVTARTEAQEIADKRLHCEVRASPSSAHTQPLWRRRAVHC